jgi:hypothetical protein
MNRGHARRSTEETSWDDARDPFASLASPIRTPSAVPVSSTRRARSSAETLRGVADPFADTEGAPPGAAGVRDWCVDRGDALVTMSTFELWGALERADVAPWMRVWREGMECWTPAGELMELSWASAGTPQPAVESETLEVEATTGPVPMLAESPAPREVSRVPKEGSREVWRASREGSRDASRASAQREASPEVPRAPREGSLAPAPAPVQRGASPEGSRAPAPSHVQQRAARWVGAGSLVAAVAIAAAFFVAAGGGAEAPAERASVGSLAEAPAPVRASVGSLAEAPAERASLGSLAEAPAPLRAHRAAGLSAPTSTLTEPTEPTVDDPPRPEPAARREERGQRRLPRGGGRAYGR